jgi:cyclic pyranopterin phosphate synthase
MPEQGINWLSREELMSYEEMLRICTVLVKSGIEKIRITGGEPFARKGIMEFLTNLSNTIGLKELTITTNGVLTAPLVPELKKIGIKSVNLSLDTLDRNKFFSITHRDEMPAVLETLEQLLHHGIDVKINTVVMDGKNTDDIISLVELTKDLPISVRFIEEMPFNGDSHTYQSLSWDYLRILDTIKQQHPEMQKLQDAAYSTSYNYHIPGHKGNVGVIAAYTRSFCGSCNRIRLTPQGVLKTCLYDNGVMNVKDLIRNGLSDETVMSEIINALNNRAKNGKEAERNRTNHERVHESMSTIGG